MQNMVTFYGAGERTGILNVEGKLSKVLGKDDGKLVIKAADRDTVLNEISARMARYQDFDQETYLELKALRQDVKDMFNKGTPPSNDLMEQLYFLDSKTKDLVEKMTASYDTVVTPTDFSLIATIMSENLSTQVPILKDFTKFFGRLAEDYSLSAKPKEANFDWKAISKKKVLGARKIGRKPPPRIAEILGINPKVSLTEATLKRFSWWNPNSTFADLMFGAKEAEFRRTGMKVGGVDVADLSLVSPIEILEPNKLPKKWIQIPWVNFDGKIVEQKFTQNFEERLRYKDADGNWVTNIIQVQQRTEPTWWQEFINKDNTINQIIDTQKARTAFPVNGNHSNDATLVKQFHIWGSKNNVDTATIHDAFFTNAADMLRAKQALRERYAKSLERNSIKLTLDEMRARGMPDELYYKYLNEAIDIGLIPVVGRSRIGGKILESSDILTVEDILENIPDGFKSNRSWYGIG